jgi:micrococcal nuclease
MHLRLALVLAGLLPVPGSAQSPAPARTSCVVQRIVDGDTFYCTDRTKVRLIGVDSPERGQGRVARRATAALVRHLPRGGTVLLESDVSPTDRYGRTLAWVWAGDTLVNELMVREGWAVRYTVPPNLKYVERLGRAERGARQAGRGLWADHGFTCRPADWRRGRCVQ